MVDDTPTNSPPSSDVSRDSPSRPSQTSARDATRTPDDIEVERATWAPVPAVRRELRPSEAAEPAPELAPLAAQLLYERAHEPSEDSPILYRERAYVVDGLQSDEELAEHLLAELAGIREEWRDRDSSQFVQLATFDHVFETEPNFPPLATLSWKDWHGRAEVWVRGVRHSGAPDGLLDLPDEPESERGFDSSDNVFDPETRPREPVLDPSGLDAPPPSHVTVELSGDSTEDPIPLVSRPGPATDHVRTRSTDSGTSWQSPSRSGEYPIPQLEEEEEEAAPPSSQRVLASEELIGALFESMHELLYLPDIAAGAQFVLEMLEEHIPCAAALVHVFDLDARQFVVVRALGPRASDVLLARGAGSGSQLEEALRRQLTLRVDGARQRLWETLGVKVERGLCSPVHQRGRYLGAIELGRGPGEGDFSDAEVAAVEYICEQFADFVADRPLDLDPASIRPSPGAEP